MGGIEFLEIELKLKNFRNLNMLDGNYVRKFRKTLEHWNMVFMYEFHNFPGVKVWFVDKHC